MTDDSAEIPAALNGSPNRSPGPAQRTAEGVTAIAGMLSRFPQSLASVLQQVPVQTRQHLCAPCVIARMTWNVAHEAGWVEAARQAEAQQAAFAAATGLAPGDPRLSQPDPAQFLPAHLQPGGGPAAMPSVEIAVTTVGGTEYCAMHVPGRPGAQKLLLANGPLSSAMLAGLG